MSVQFSNQPIRFKADEQQINYNYRQPQIVPDPMQDMFLMQQRMAKKENSRDKWNKAGVIAQVGIALGFIGSAIVTFWATKFNSKIAEKQMAQQAKLLEKELGKTSANEIIDKFNPIDVSKEKSIAELSLGKEMQKAYNDLMTLINRGDWLKKKGAKGNTAIMLYGEPGGGKNAFVYALTKAIQEKNPETELIAMDVLKFNGKYHGETENNIIGFVEGLIKRANDNPNKKIIVFLDEFDSIARKHDGANDAALNEKFQNAFKQTLTKLTNVDNIQVISATNKAEKEANLNKLLDDAILNRFGKKIFVPLPNENQIMNAIVEHYKSIPSEFIDSRLMDKNNPELKALCKYIVKPEHHASFRNLGSILDSARVLSESNGRKEGSKITLEDFTNAVKECAENENWDIKRTGNNIYSPINKKETWWQALWQKMTNWVNK